MLSLPIPVKEGARRSRYAIIDPALIDPAILIRVAKEENNNENNYLFASSIVTGVLFYNS